MNWILVALSIFSVPMAAVAIYAIMKLGWAAEKIEAYKEAGTRNQQELLIQMDRADMFQRKAKDALDMLAEKNKKPNPKVRAAK